MSSSRVTQATDGPGSVDLEGARQAVKDLLRALGAPLDTDPELADTPSRVATMLASELLDGYSVDLDALLQDGVEATSQDLVLLRDIRFSFVCPHHMLPSTGRAHVAYLPSARVLGLGTLVKLVEALAHRLVLQESLGVAIAQSLCTRVGARGAAVLLHASHDCLSVRGETQRDASVITTAFSGTMATEGPDRALFFAALAATQAPSTR
ncbi:MAG: GTP cyclohydrolase I [Deltaproteobacteria bacterium]|nr:GTP cyclohydrolase I [Deltaproteobacteria bacterium]